MSTIDRQVSSEQNQSLNPSPKRIRKMCKKIRKGWTRQQARKRQMRSATRWDVPVYRDPELA